MKKILFAVMALSISFTALAQEKFEEGKMISKQTITSDNEQMSAMMASIGDIVSTTYVKGSKSRTETSNPMSGDITVITDNDAHEMLMIMDTPGGKMYSKQSVKPTEETLESIKIEKGTETKTILGYECKQYTVSADVEGQTIEMELFVTEKIKPILTQQTAVLAGKVNGFPLYMVMKMNQQGTNMTITTEITEMVSESVDESKLDMTPPEGYKNIGQ
ncbi:hypothetical protein Q2T40_06990 [Winogradskyella maritima]|uniref:DUF4412 domain-containing protein n=1 Tax=Winogradskyella maritima TaxID=1517766 RepID=A0ABV8AL85_9FLAO|nr:hypothetical protein [Winogradskyella maritima]